MEVEAGKFYVLDAVMLNRSASVHYQEADALVYVEQVHEFEADVWLNNAETVRVPKGCLKLHWSQREAQNNINQ